MICLLLYNYQFCHSNIVTLMLSNSSLTAVVDYFVIDYSSTLFLNLVLNTVFLQNEICQFAVFFYGLAPALGISWSPAAIRQTQSLTLNVVWHRKANDPFIRAQKHTHLVRTPQSKKNPTQLHENFTPRIEPATFLCLSGDRAKPTCQRPWRLCQLLSWQDDDLKRHVFAICSPHTHPWAPAPPPVFVAAPLCQNPLNVAGLTTTYSLTHADALPLHIAPRTFLHLLACPASSPLFPTLSIATDCQA